MSPPTQEWSVLCEKVKQLVPREISDRAWILVTAATLATSPYTDLLADFYTHLIQNDSSFQSEEARNRLSIQFRDISLKLLPLLGAPRMLCALMPLVKAEGDVDRKAATSVLNEKWNPEKMNIQAIVDRGSSTINAIYGSPLLSKIFDAWGSHKEDLRFNELFAVYGLYLSDFEVLTALETEAVVYATISCLGLGGPGNWHLRGMGRMLGARGTDQESDHAKRITDQLNNLREAIHLVVKFCGEDFVRVARLDQWATVEGMLEQFGSWGTMDGE